MFGYHSLLITPVQYSTLKAFPFDFTTNPGLFITLASAAQLTETHKVWNEDHHTFELSQAVEKALIAQLIAAFDSAYLAALCNATTSWYGYNILSLLQHLQKSNGCLTPPFIKSKEMEICNTQYDMVHPVDRLMWWMTLVKYAFLRKCQCLKPMPAIWLFLSLQVTSFSSKVCGPGTAALLRTKNGYQIYFRFP